MYEGAPQAEIGQEQKSRLMAYLKENSDTAIGDELEMPTTEEEVMAENLLALPLSKSDAAPDRIGEYADSNYKPDVEARTKAFEEAGIDSNVEIRRYNFALNSNLSEQMNLKVINLIRREIEQGKIEGEPDKEKIVNIPGSVLFLGKVKHNNQHTEYENLNDDDRQKIAQFIEKQQENVSA